MNTKVYLAGPINGRTDSQAMDWRQWVTSRLDSTRFAVLDPMRRDYRGKEAANVNAIVQGDLDDISGSDVIIVNAESPSWGTAMELVYAHMWRKYVIAVTGETPREKLSPWLVFHTTMQVVTMQEAVELVEKLVPVAA